MTRFARRVVVLDPGTTRPAAAAEWEDAVVLVERGAIEVEAPGGAPAVRFGAGSVLALGGAAVVANRGAEPAVLVAVARRLRAVR